MERSAVLLWNQGRRLTTVSIAMPRRLLSLQYARAALQKEMQYSTFFDNCEDLCTAPGPPVSAWLELPTANTLDIQPPHPSVPQSFL